MLRRGARKSKVAEPVEKPAEVSARKVIEHIPPGMPVQHSDHALVSCSVFGFRLTFCTIRIGDNLFAVADTHTQIGMSAEHARALHMALGKQLGVFEERYGPIRPLSLKGEKP